MMKDIDVHRDLHVRPLGSVSHFKGYLPIQRVRSLFRHRKEDLRSFSRGWGWRHHGQSQGADCRTVEGLATAAMSTHSQGESSYLLDGECLQQYNACFSPCKCIDIPKSSAGINTEPSEEVNMIWNSAQVGAFHIQTVLEHP